MKLLILFGLTLLCGVESLKVLVYYPLPVRSVSMLGNGVVKHLLDAGHEVNILINYYFYSSCLSGYILILRFQF